MNTKKLKVLVRQYLEGEISPEQECRLNDFLGTDPSRWGTFRQLEQEWRSMRSPSMSDRLMYGSIASRIRSRRKRKLSRIAISSAATVLAVLAVIGTVYSSLQSAAVEDRTDDTLVTVPDAMRTHIVLADGSSVWLNSSSSLRYGSGFGVDSRDVYMDGEALFDVSPDMDCPFLVHLPSGTVEVTGTRFNVSCYDTMDDIQVALISGTVNFISENGVETGMEAGELLDYDVESGTSVKSKTRVSQYTAWTEGRIDFESITLDAFFRRLSAQYGVDIIYDADTLADKGYRILLNNSESLDEILYALSVIAPISYIRKPDGGIYVTASGGIDDNHCITTR